MFCCYIVFFFFNTTLTLRYLQIEPYFDSLQQHKCKTVHIWRLFSGKRIQLPCIYYPVVCTNESSKVRCGCFSPNILRKLLKFRRFWHSTSLYRLMYRCDNNSENRIHNMTFILWIDFPTFLIRSSQVFFELLNNSII